MQKEHHQHRRHQHQSPAPLQHEPVLHSRHTQEQNIIVASDLEHRIQNRDQIHAFSSPVMKIGIIDVPQNICDNEAGVADNCFTKNQFFPLCNHLLGNIPEDEQSHRNIECF